MPEILHDVSGSTSRRPTDATTSDGNNNTNDKRGHDSKHAVTYGAGDVLGAGDSSLRLIEDLLDVELRENVFEKVRSEVEWASMYHRGGEVPRLVAVQGDVSEDGSYPIYRHPSDASPPLKAFTPTVHLIRRSVEQLISHPLNHALIQQYRTGADYISEHSDKTIDVVRGSVIVNVSLGAERTMVLKRKRDVGVGDGDEKTNDPTSLDPTTRVHHHQGPSRQSQRIPLPHGSTFIMGPLTNAKWTHAIPHDKRPLSHKAPLEQAYGGVRISLTFRHIGTFLSPSFEIEGGKATGTRLVIWGQGATGKTREEAHEVVVGGSQAARLLEEFGKENRGTGFDWEASYGMGYDVLHFDEGHGA